MSFCEHCEGQRFDRAQVLRALRAARKEVRKRSRTCRADEALRLAIEAVRTLEIPHLEGPDEPFDEQMVH
jgi:imidazolonepropionase-like amidohydrolase